MSSRNKKCQRKDFICLFTSNVLTLYDLFTTVPTLIIHGDKDPMVSIDLAREIESTLTSNGTQVAYKSIPDGKHNLHFKYADQFAQWVMDFVQ